MKYGEQESKSYWETCLSPRPHWDPFRDWGYGMQQSGLPTASGTQDWINQQPFRQQANTPYEFNKFQSQVTTENGQWKLALNVRFFEPEGTDEVQPRELKYFKVSYIVHMMDHIL